MKVAAEVTEVPVWLNKARSASSSVHTVGTREESIWYHVLVDSIPEVSCARRLNTRSGFFRKRVL